MLKKFQLSLEDRDNFKSKIAEEAQEYGIKVVFSEMPLGVYEHLVIVFDVRGNDNIFFLFQRECLKLGTPEAGKYIKNTRSITVH